ncbi:unnamed protein product [Aureobasidium uvarum]|uniref:peptidylprolyl isomerase n=1 Tax=Aureobasidium uvarum TaxID=2773716 RepID=A0A9N8PV60_9PEZI|nr:unnamed protein product [Aureobasidium uvarum]
MGVTKQIIKQGDGVNFPKNGDNLHSLTHLGFDSSVGRGDFDVPIGTGRVIKGWDHGIVEQDGGMSLGEKATLTITPDFGYGARGFPGAIPQNATLIFDVELKAIGNKRA